MYCALVGLPALCIVICHLSSAIVICHLSTPPHSVICALRIVLCIVYFVYLLYLHLCIVRFVAFAGIVQMPRLGL